MLTPTGACYAPQPRRDYNNVIYYAVSVEVIIHSILKLFDASPFLKKAALAT